MKELLSVKRLISALLAAAIGLPAPAYDRGSREPAAGNGAASSGRSHALRPSVEGVQAGLEERLTQPNAAPTAGLAERVPLREKVSFGAVQVIPAAGVPARNGAPVVVAVGGGVASRFRKSVQDAKRAKALSADAPENKLLYPVGPDKLPAGVIPIRKAQELGADVDVLAIVSPPERQGDLVRQAYDAAVSRPITYAVQGDPLGTGHAVYHALAAFKDPGALDRPVVVMMGDQTLLGYAFKGLLDYAEKEKADIVVSASRFADPKGKGRVVVKRGTSDVTAIVEQAVIDAMQPGERIHGCTKQELDSNPLGNVSLYYFRSARLLLELLALVTPTPPKNEYYVTDVIQNGVRRGGLRILLHEVDPRLQADLTTLANVPEVEHSLDELEGETAAGLEEKVYWKFQNRGISVEDFARFLPTMDLGGAEIYLQFSDADREAVRRFSTEEGRERLSRLIFTYENRNLLLDPEKQLGRSEGSRLTQLNQEITDRSHALVVEAHGISYSKGGLMTLAQVILDGELKMGQKGLLAHGILRLGADLQLGTHAGSHGPFYIVVNCDDPDWKRRDHHVAYLLPHQVHRDALIRFLTRAAEAGLIEREGALRVFEKIRVYEEGIPPAWRWRPLTPSPTTGSATNPPAGLEEMIDDDAKRELVRMARSVMDHPRVNEFTTPEERDPLYRLLGSYRRTHGRLPVSRTTREILMPVITGALERKQSMGIQSTPVTAAAESPPPEESGLPSVERQRWLDLSRQVLAELINQAPAGEQEPIGDRTSVAVTDLRPASSAQSNHVAPVKIANLGQVKGVLDGNPAVGFSLVLKKVGSEDPSPNFRQTIRLGLMTGTSRGEGHLQLINRDLGLFLKDMERFHLFESAGLEEMIRENHPDFPGGPWLNAKRFSAWLNAAAQAAGNENVSARVKLVGSGQGLQTQDGWIPLDRVEDLDLRLEMMGRHREAAPAHVQFLNAFKDAIREQVPPELKEHLSVDVLSLDKHVVFKIPSRLGSREITLELWPWVNSSPQDQSDFLADGWEETWNAWPMRRQEARKWFKRYLAMERVFGDPVLHRYWAYRFLQIPSGEPVLDLAQKLWSSDRPRELREHILSLMKNPSAGGLEESGKGAAQRVAEFKLRARTALGLLYPELARKTPDDHAIGKVPSKVVRILLRLRLAEAAFEGNRNRFAITFLEDAGSILNELSQDPRKTELDPQRADELQLTTANLAKEMETLLPELTQAATGLRVVHPDDEGKRPDELIASPSGLEGAQQYIEALAGSKQDLTQEQLVELNARLQGIGLDHHFAGAADPADDRSKDFLRWVNLPVEERTSPAGYPSLKFLANWDSLGDVDWRDPISRAAVAHWLLFKMRPYFIEGHHRTGWALMNILLRRDRHSSIAYRPEWEEDYRRNLDHAFDPRPFIQFVRGCVSAAGLEELDEPQLRQDNAYAAAHRALLSGPEFTEESRRRLLAMKELGPRVEAAFRNRYGDPKLSVLLIPRGSALKGYANSGSDVDLDIVVLYEPGRFKRLADSGIDQDILNLFREKGLLVHHDIRWTQRFPLIEEHGIAKNERASTDVDRSNWHGYPDWWRMPSLFLPVAYGNPEWVERARRNIVSFIGEKTTGAEGMWLWMRSEYYRSSLSIDPEDLLVRPHLKSWLSSQGVDITDDRAIENFNVERFQQIGLPNLTEMAKIYQVPISPPAAGLEEVKIGEPLAGTEDQLRAEKNGRDGSVPANGRGALVAAFSGRLSQRSGLKWPQTTQPRKQSTGRSPSDAPPLPFNLERDVNQGEIKPQADEKSDQAETLTQHAPQDKAPQHPTAGIDGDLQQGVPLLERETPHGQIFSSYDSTSSISSRKGRSPLLSNYIDTNANIPGTSSLVNSAAGLEEIRRIRDAEPDADKEFADSLLALNEGWFSMGESDYQLQLRWVSGLLSEPLQRIFNQQILRVGDAVHGNAPRDPVLYATAFYILERPMARIEQAVKQGDITRVHELETEYGKWFPLIREILRQRNEGTPPAPALSVSQLFLNTLSIIFDTSVAREADEKFIEVVRRLRYLPGAEKYFAVALDLWFSGNHGRYGFENEDLSGSLPNALFAWDALTNPAALAEFPDPLRAEIRMALKIGLVNYGDAFRRYAAWFKERQMAVAVAEPLAADFSRRIQSRQLLAWFDEMWEADPEVTKFLFTQSWIQYSRFFKTGLFPIRREDTPVPYATAIFNLYSPRYRALLGDMPFSAGFFEGYFEDDLGVFLWGRIQTGQDATSRDLRIRIDNRIASLRQNLSPAGLEEIGPFLEEIRQGRVSAIEKLGDWLYRDASEVERLRPHAQELAQALAAGLSHEDTGILEAVYLTVSRFFHPVSHEPFHQALLDNRIAALAVAHLARLIPEEGGEDMNVRTYADLVLKGMLNHERFYPAMAAQIPTLASYAADPNMNLDTRIRSTRRLIAMAENPHELFQQALRRLSPQRLDAATYRGSPLREVLFPVSKDPAGLAESGKGAAQRVAEFKLRARTALGLLYPELARKTPDDHVIGKVPSRVVRILLRLSLAEAAFEGNRNRFAVAFLEDAGSILRKLSQDPRKTELDPQRADELQLTTANLAKEMETLLPELTRAATGLRVVHPDDEGERPDEFPAPTAGLEEGRVAVEIPIGQWEEELNDWLTGLGGILVKTEHYGEGTIFLRVAKPSADASYLYDLKVEMIAEKGWIQKATRRYSGQEGTLGFLLLERKRVNGQSDAAFIVGMKLFPWVLELPYRDEIDPRRAAIEAIGEWGKSRTQPVPIYFIGPKAAKRFGRNLSDPTILWNYKYPVDPSLWGTESVRVIGSRFLWRTESEGPLKWFVYRGKSGDPPARPGDNTVERREEKSSPMTAGEAAAYLRRILPSLEEDPRRQVSEALLVLRNLRPGQNSFHVGSGASLLPVAEALMGLHVHAVDVDPNGVAAMNDLISIRGIREEIARRGGELEFIEGDITHMEIPAEVDHLVAIDLFPELDSDVLVARFPGSSFLAPESIRDNDQAAMRRLYEATAARITEGRKAGLTLLVSGGRAPHDFPSALRNRFRAEEIPFNEQDVSVKQVSDFPLTLFTVPAAGMEEGIKFVRPEEVPDFKKPEDLFDSRFGGKGHQQVSTLALLNYLKMGPSTTVFNVAYGDLPLVLPEPWAKPVNLDPDPMAAPRSHPLTAKYLVDDIFGAVAMGYSKRVVLLYRPGIMPFWGDESFKDTWALVKPGGWLFLIQPMQVPRRNLKYFHTAFLGALHPQDPSQVIAVSPDGTLDNALALMLQKPAAGLEERGTEPSFHSEWDPRRQVRPALLQAFGEIGEAFHQTPDVQSVLEQTKTLERMAQPLNPFEQFFVAIMRAQYESLWAGMTRDLRLADRAIHRLEGLRDNPVQKLPGAHEDRAVFHQMIAGAYSVRGFHSGNPEDLHRALADYRMAMAIAGSGGIKLSDAVSNNVELIEQELSQEAGLEEQSLAILEEAAPQGEGILVIEARALSGRAGLEEFIARLGPAVKRRVVLFGRGSAAAKELAARNGIDFVDSDDLADLAFRLAGMGERANRIGYIGNLRIAGLLSRILPASMAVTPLDPRTALFDMLLFLGYPSALLDGINTSGLEELFAPSRAA